MKSVSANVWVEKRDVHAYCEVWEIREILKAETFLKAVIWWGRVYTDSLFYCLFSCSVVSDSFSTPIDCSPLVSSVHGISRARILEWVAVLFSRVFSRGWTHIS